MKIVRQRKNELLGATGSDQSGRLRISYAVTEEPRMRRRAFLAGSAAMLANVAEGNAHEAKDTTDGLTVMVTRRVQAGKEPEAEAVLRDLQAATLANDEGCLRYEWYRASTPQTYILLERWADPAAAQKHVKSPHFVSAIAKLSPLVLEKPEVVWLTRL